MWGQVKTEQAYIPIEKIIRTSKQSASTSWQCNTSGNRHQPATYHMGTCAWSVCDVLLWQRICQSYQAIFMILAHYSVCEEDSEVSHSRTIMFCFLWNKILARNINDEVIASENCLFILECYYTKTLVYYCREPSSCVRFFDTMPRIFCSLLAK